MTVVVKLNTPRLCVNDTSYDVYCLHAHNRPALSHSSRIRIILRIV